MAIKFSLTLQLLFGVEVSCSGQPTNVCHIIIQINTYSVYSLIFWLF